mmetsp:Transcript_19978/g.51522  ORF Transcript_19978/g.51522 Transcript_19978/m.51522 type:complete len:224 (+) Transcript_19978:513-1184(+)
MTEAPTPSRTASDAVCSFGIIPPVMVPSSTRRWTSVVPSCSMSAPLWSSTPATSVRSNSRDAPTADAIAPAAVSALMLYDAPSAIPTPMGAMTGIAPMPTRSCSRLGSMWVGSPTRPRSAFWREPSLATIQCSMRVAPMRPHAWPVSPTALPPAREISLTSLLFTSPPSTISTTSIVRWSVTRRPSTKSDLICRSLSIRVICGPPPCTIMTFTPSERNNATSA